MLDGFKGKLRGNTGFLRLAQIQCHPVTRLVNHGGILVTWTNSSVGSQPLIILAICLFGSSRANEQRLPGLVVCQVKQTAHSEMAHI